MDVVDKYAKNNLRDVYAEDDGTNGLHFRSNGKSGKRRQHQTKGQCQLLTVWRFAEGPGPGPTPS